MTTSTSKNSAKKPSKAEKIMSRLEHEQLLDAPPGQEVENGRRIADFVFTAMELGSMNVRDAAVVLICRARGGAVKELVYAHENADTNDLMLSGEIAKHGWLPVGVVVAILDREERGGGRVPLRLHAEVFEGCDESLEFIRKAFKVLEKMHEKGQLPN